MSGAPDCTCQQSKLTAAVKIKLTDPVGNDHELRCGESLGLAEELLIFFVPLADLTLYIQFFEPSMNRQTSPFSSHEFSWR